MAKVVYNACYGGFGLSRAATERLAAMGVEAAQAHLSDPYAVGYEFSGYGIARHDPRLVRVVEDMGDAANGRCAELLVEDLGDGPRAYRIEEHDGKERVEYVDANVAHDNERAAILRFMADRKAYYERGSCEAAGQDVREACRAKVSLLESLIGDIERGDHMKAAQDGDS